MLSAMKRFLAEILDTSCVRPTEASMRERERERDVPGVIVIERTYAVLYGKL